MYVFHISCIIIFLLMIYFSYGAGMRKNVSNDLSHVDSVIETTSTVNKTEENKNTDLDLTSFSPDVDLEYYREYYNNNEIVARLEIPNLFNLMITKTTNNEYYLDHSIDRNSNIEGTEFMDFQEYLEFHNKGVQYVFIDIPDEVLLQQQERAAAMINQEAHLMGLETPKEIIEDIVLREKYKKKLQEELRISKRKAERLYRYVKRCIMKK